MRTNSKGISFASYYPRRAAGIILTDPLSRRSGEFVGVSGFPLEQPERTYLDNTLSDGICSDPEVRKQYQQDPLVEKKVTVGLLNSLSRGVTWLMEHPERFRDPVLILHGERDPIIRWQDSVQLYEEIASADKSLRIYSGLYHEILNEPVRDFIIEDIVNWINRQGGNR